MLVWITVVAVIVAAICFVEAVYHKDKADNLERERNRWSVIADEWGFRVSLFLGIPGEDEHVSGWYAELKQKFEKLDGQEVAFAERYGELFPSAKELRAERFILRMVRERVNFLLDDEFSIYNGLSDLPGHEDEILIKLPQAETVVQI